MINNNDMNSNNKKRQYWPIMRPIKIEQAKHQTKLRSKILEQENCKSKLQ